MSSAARSAAMDSRVQTFLIIAGYMVVSYAIFSGFASADLNALFLAALNFGAGQTGAVYPDSGPVFQLAVPPGWDTQAADLGIDARPLFPFIYPPLWAAAFAPLAAAVGPGAFTTAAFLINPVLVGLSAVLGHRIMQPAMTLPVWLLLCLVIVTTTTFGYVALLQNQPQILVSFLILLALERDRSGAPVAAGIALALAASLKLYPALFVVFWLAAGNFRASAAFLGAGAGLGGLSVALAGWPLHVDFLNQIRVIANSLISSSINYSIDSTLTQWVLSDFLTTAVGEQGQTLQSASNVIVAVKPAIIRMSDRLIMIAGLAALSIAILRADTETRFRRLYPAGIIFVALASPLTWAYHYLSVVFLFPALIENFRRGWVIFLTLAIAYNGGTVWLLDRLPTPYFIAQIVGSSGMVVLLIIFLCQPRFGPSNGESA